MANQYTKKKQQREAADRVAQENKRAAEAPRPELHVHEIDFGTLFEKAFGAAFPKMSKCDEQAKHMPHFTLLAKDNFTPFLIQAWINLGMQHGVPEAKIIEAKYLLESIERWRTKNPMKCKTPD